MNRIYPAKLILFGEYSLLLGSQVLGVPLQQYYGLWGNSKTNSSELKPHFFDFLVDECSDLLDPLKVSELKSGRVYYNSTISRGYGIGSSGALSAAVFDYCKKTEISDLSYLQEVLALIEGFFHGKSSGFDPLLSYLNQPILKNKAGQYSTPSIHDISSRPLPMYLLDSGTKRKVKGLVPLFAQNAAEKPDKYQELADINDALIDQLLSAGSIKQLFKELSAFQLAYLTPMILDPLIHLWSEGLRTDQYYIKICGAGGGGFYIVYSEADNIQDLLSPYQLEPIILT